MMDFNWILALIAAWPLPTRQQWEALQKALPEMIAALRWTPVEELLPEMKPGLPSELVLVQVQEFGQQPSIAIARCWQSSLPDQPVTWYLDPEVYHLEGPWRIAEPVVAWLAIPPFTTEKP